MKKLGKILILVISVAVVLSALIIVVSAADDTVAVVGSEKFASFDEALDVAKESGGKLTLVKDAEMNKSVALKKSLEIELGNNNLTVDFEDTAFVLSGDVTLTVTGKGKITSKGLFIETENSDAGSPTVNILGESGIMKINSIYGNFVTAHTGTFNFKNLDVTANTVDSGTAIFTCASESQTLRCDAVMNFTGVVVNSPEAAGAYSSIVRLEGKSLLRTKYCTFRANSCVISFANDDVDAKKYNGYVGTDDVIIADNCYFSSIKMVTSSGDSWKLGVIGMYADVPGKMIFNNSVLESSYRPICLNLKSSGQLILNNSAIKHSGLSTKENLLVRGCNVIVNKGSMLTSAVGLGGIHYEDADADPKTYVVFMDGSRISKRIYDSLFVNNQTSGVRFGKEVVDGEGVKQLELYELPDNKTFTVIYDPIGNSEAPFLVLERTYDANGAETTPKGVDCSGLLYSSSSAGIPKEDFYKDAAWFLGDTKFPNEPAGDYVPQTRWNSNGIFTGIGYNNNDVFKYVVDEKNKNSNNNMTLAFCLKQGVQYSSNAVYVTEADIAFTSEEGIVPGTLTVHARGSGDSPGATGNCTGSAFTVRGDGTVSVGNNTTSFKIETDKWHHITIVTYTKKGSANTGEAHFYIDGTYLGKGSGYDVKKGGQGDAYLFGMRYDVNGTTSVPNSAIYFDNQTFSAYENYKVGSDEDPLIYSPTKGMPLNSGDINASVTVGGIGFANLDEALEAAESIGAFASLVSDVKGQVVTKKGTLLTNGYSITVGEGSTAANVVTDADGNPVSYIFDPAFNSLFVKYQWFIGDKSNISELRDPAKYVETQVYVGKTPEFSGAVAPDVSRRDGQDIYVTEHAGWSTDVDAAKPADLLPVSVSDVLNMGETPVKIYPVYIERALTEYDVAVLDSNGTFIRGYKASNGIIDESGWNSIGLAYGETFVLMSSDVTIISAFTSARAENGNEKVFSFDVNGHKMNIDFSKHKSSKLPIVFKILTGETMNFYSSVAGASVQSQGITSDGNMTGGDIFSLNGAGDGVKDPTLSMSDTTNHNAHLNVGTVTAFEKTYPGSNLTFNADCLVHLANGDKTCSAKVDGVSIVRTMGYRNGLFRNYYSSASLDVTNCNIFFPDKENILLICGFSKGLTDVNGDGKKDENDVKYGVATEATKPFRAASDVKFDGCSIFAAENSVDDSGSLIQDDYTLKSVLFTNCITNAGINPSKTGYAVRIGDGCLVYNPSASRVTGVDKYLYNRDMTFGSYTDENTVTVSYVKDFVKNSDTDYTFNYAEFTYALIGADADADVILPNFVYKFTTPDKTHKVTVVDNDKNVLSTSIYADGGYVLVNGIKNIYDGTAIACVADGTVSPALPDGVTEDVTVTPNFKPVSNLSSLKTNVTLNSDFTINLMIPVTYKDSVAGASAGGNKLEIKENGEYLVISVPVLARNATDKVEFTVELEESNYTAVHTVTYGVADYAKTILKNEDSAYTEADRKLAWYVLNYAVEVDKYFDGKTDNEAVALLEAYADVKGEATERVYENALEEIGLSEVFDWATVKLVTAPTYVFTVKAGFAGTVSVTTSEGNYTFTVKASDEDTKLEIVGLNAYELAETATIEVKGTLNGKSVSIEDGKFNIATFANYHKVNSRLNKASSKAINLVNALYDYVIAANAYKAI